MTSPATAPTFRPIADPGPLGLAAFALTTFVLSVFNAGLVDASAEPVVFGVALFYGGLAQLLAGVIEYFKNNLFGGLAFCSYGAFWMAFWYLSTHPELFADTTHKATGVGIFLLAWTIFTAYMLVAVSKVNWGLTVTFAVLFIAFVGLTIGDLAGLEAATRVGGWFGLAAAFSAWYCSFAGVLNFTSGKTVLSVGPKGSSH
ncbi:MAG: acetate uptake transporter [Propionibacteriaceae bacterium]|jgi:succinate-acetate transporter protein|nr:acetate uptake transporter [Propionibacteriaceae bacterium]